jgi:hypothetical protein
MRSINAQIVVTLDDIDYTIDVAAHLSIDSHYGADIDGNRGVPTLSIEDLHYTLPPGLSSSNKTKLYHIVYDMVERAINE